MRFVCLSLAAAMLIVFVASQPAVARLQFYQQFEKEYLNSHPDKKYAEALKKAPDKCLVCHQGKNKKHHNEFGKHVKELLTKNDMKNADKIKESLKKVLAMHVDPKDDKSETYLDRVKASKWPGGELDDLKKEPKDDGKSVAGK